MWACAACFRCSRSCCSPRSWSCPGRLRRRDAHLQGAAVQEQTIRHHNASNGSDLSKDTFSTELRLFAIGTVIGFPDNTPMGTMEFNWGPLNGNCSSSAAGCSGTTNINTFTKLPGGTLTAGGQNVSLSKGIVVPIQSGTGIFKGATGSIDIAPASIAEDVFNLKLPA